MKVCFLCEQTNPRMARLATYLSTRPDVDVILLKSHGRDLWGVESLVTSHTEFRSSLFQRRYIHKALREIECDAIHAFGPPSWVVRAAIEAKTAPVVVDYYDWRVLYWGRNPKPWWLKHDLMHEGWVADHAKMVIGRNHEPEAAFSLYGRPQPSVVTIPDAMLKIAPSVPMRWGKNQLHVVYVGAIYGDRGSEMSGHSNFIEIFSEACSDPLLHIHCYSSPASQSADKQESYIRLASKPNFHLHDPIPMSQLPTALSQYHAGIIPIWRNRSTILDKKFEYASSNKLTDYFEAGLPAIVSDALVYQSGMVADLGWGYSISRSDISCLRYMIDYKHLFIMKNRLRQTWHKRFSMEETFGPNLISIYEEIIA